MILGGDGLVWMSVGGSGWIQMCLDMCRWIWIGLVSGDGFRWQWIDVVRCGSVQVVLGDFRQMLMGVDECERLCVVLDVGE